jgi:hypothetical protein
LADEDGDEGESHWAVCGRERRRERGEGRRKREVVRANRQ